MVLLRHCDGVVVIINGVFEKRRGSEAGEYQKLTVPVFVL
jgi:hypothetical protein